MHLLRSARKYIVSPTPRATATRVLIVCGGQINKRQGVKKTIKDWRILTSLSSRLEGQERHPSQVGYKLMLKFRLFHSATAQCPTRQPDKQMSANVRSRKTIASPEGTSHLHHLWLILLLVTGMLVSCQARAAEPEAAHPGRIILWHSWREQEEEALDSLLARFTAIYPELTVITARYAPDALKHEYLDKVAQGLGPDLMIGTQEWTPELADANLIRALAPERIDTSIYLSSALQTLHYNQKLYGLPLSVQTSALYYNRTLVETPPTTLQALIEEAGNGQKVALNTSFAAAFWGVQAFGGQLLDDEGHIVLNQGGLANWLGWLIEAQNVPNIILSNDEEILDTLFADGEAAYYIAPSTELLRLQEILGKEGVGVAPLPAGPHSAAGPFLETEPIFFSTASSPRQFAHALRLAEFLTNVEQQRKLAQLAGRIPANPRARIDRRVSSAVAGFVEQSKTAVPLLLIPQVVDAIAFGEEAYVQALEGMHTPVEVATDLTRQVNEKYGLETRDVASTVQCLAGQGRVEIWHDWPNPEATALSQIAENFQTLCPGTLIALTAVPPGELISLYEEAIRAGNGPDLLLTSSEFATQLASAELVRDLTELIPPSFLQRYIPTVPNTLRYRGDLYGLPIALDTMALYYNASMISKPPVDLGDFLRQVRPDRQAVLPYAPYAEAHWGLSAFGSRLFDAEGNLVLNNQGFTEWLDWLRTAQEHPGIIFTREAAEGETLFANGQAAFLASDRSALTRLQGALGTDRVRVAPLPSGPEGASGPILTVSGFMLSPLTDQNRARLAIEFAQFVASVESQTQMMAQANLIPANIHVNTLDEYPAIAGFLEQANTAIILPNRQETTTILELGSTIFENILETDTASASVLDDFAAFVAGVHQEARPEETVVTACEEQGNLTVWHSTLGAEANVLGQIVAAFARECPDIGVDLAYVPADELPQHLAASSHLTAEVDTTNEPTTASTETPAATVSGQSASASIPDLLLAPHDLVAPLSEERLIRPISAWVAGATLIPYHPQAVRAFRYENALYGLPYQMETMALYYNRDLISSADAGEDGAPHIASLYDLFAAASPETPLALDTSFEGAFWGALAFGRTAFEERTHGSDASIDHLDQTGLVGWLAWLQANRNRTGIIMSQDQQKLREIFGAGNAAYLIASSNALPLLRAELDNPETGESKVGVMLLPEGPAGQASPFYRVNGFLFHAAASEQQTELAVRFAEFATGSVSQELLMAQTDLPPANTLARTQTMSPALNTFVAQTDVGIPLPPRPQNQVLFAGGNALYAGVLERDQDPSDAMGHFADYLDSTPLPDLIAYTGDSVLACGGEQNQEQQLVFWHSWDFAQTNALSGDDSAAEEGVTQTEALTQTNPITEEMTVMEQIVADFANHCPNVEVRMEQVAVEELPSRLQAAQADKLAPDLFIAPHDLIQPLAEGRLIRPITGLVGDALLASYLPKTVAAVEHDEEIYGLPQSMDVMALYYNTALVSNPVSTLDELLNAATPEALVVLDATFYGAFWGVPAFGAKLFDSEGQLTLQEDGFLEWLTWLQSARDNPGVVLSDDQDQMLRLFAEGKAAYLVAGPNALPPLRRALGAKVRVIPLPVGPSGKAGPFLRVHSFLFSASVNEAQTELALAFAGFVSSAVNQTLLQKEASLIPTNRQAAETVDDSAIKNFIRQADESAVIVPNAPEMALLQSGNSIYVEMVINGLDPKTVVQRLMEAIAGDREQGG